jgi:hypothetical protein
MSATPPPRPLAPPRAGIEKKSPAAIGHHGLVAPVESSYAPIEHNLAGI